ncbi:hypothetical protein H2248_004240 [Termitomyces sp. 'cryptogamus']|nr:hypothetical protein H2248_004240 [Termitomyces sp. 'cryptogamus']
MCESYVVCDDRKKFVLLANRQPEVRLDGEAPHMFIRNLFSNRIVLSPESKEIYTNTMYRSHQDRVAHHMLSKDFMRQSSSPYLLSSSSANTVHQECRQRYISTRHLGLDRGRQFHGCLKTDLTVTRRKDEFKQGIMGMGMSPRL